MCSVFQDGVWVEKKIVIMCDIVFLIVEYFELYIITCSIIFLIVKIEKVQSTSMQLATAGF